VWEQHQLPVPGSIGAYWCHFLIYLSVLCDTARDRCVLGGTAAALCTFIFILKSPFVMLEVVLLRMLHGCRQAPCRA